MSRTDYYAMLGVAQTANKEEIQAAFRKLVQTRHPDRRRDVEYVRAVEEFQALTQAANTLLDAGRRVEYDRTRRSLGRQLSTEEEAIRTLVQRGIHAFRQGDLQTAMESLEKATQSAPDQVRPWHLLAQVSAKAGKKSLAMRAAQKAVELEPNNPTYLMTAGRLYFEAGRAGVAQQLLEQAEQWGAESAQVRPLLDELKKKR